MLSGMHSLKALFWLVAAGFILAASSHGALNWTVHPITPAGTNETALLYDVAFGNGKFLAVERSGQTYSAPGSDPYAWTSAAKISDVDLETIIFAGGRFAAAGSDMKTAKAVFLSSADGTNWTRQTFERPGRWRGVAYGNGQFVLAGDDIVARSANGVVWVIETNFVRNPKVHFTSVDFVNGEFIAAFFDEWPPGLPYAPTKLAISADGRNWREHEIMKEGFGEITYGRKMYLAPGMTDCLTCGWLYFSTDGRNWEEGAFPGQYDGLEIAYANGLFAVSAWGSPPAFLTSTDGMTWDEFQIGSGEWFHGLAFGNGRFVAVGYSLGQEWNPSRESGQGLVAVSDFVGEGPRISNLRVTAEVMEFDFNAKDETEWQVESSEDLVSWSVVGEIEGTQAEVQSVSVPRQGQRMQFLRVKEK